MKKASLITGLVLMASVHSTTQAAGVTLSEGKIGAGMISSGVVIQEVKDANGNELIPAKTKLTGGEIFFNPPENPRGTLEGGTTENGAQGDQLIGATLNAAKIKGVSVKGATWTVSQDGKSTTTKIDQAVKIDLSDAEVTKAGVTQVKSIVPGTGKINNTLSDAEKRQNDFLSQGAWGTGVSWLWNSRPVISNASITNNVVRADTVQQSQPELLLRALL